MTAMIIATMAKSGHYAFSGAKQLIYRLALVLALGVGLSSVGGLLKGGSSYPLYTVPAAFAGMVMLVMVVKGVRDDRPSLVLGGVAYGASMAAVMAYGQYKFEDGLFFGYVYLGFAVMLTCVAGVVSLHRYLDDRASL